MRDDPLPESVDWRTLGGVNPIQDQGNCGSCWAFSAIASLEGAYFATSGNLIKVSEQQIVDCAGLQYKNFGCLGGNVWGAWDYLEIHSSILETDYPYKGRLGKCRYDDGGPYTHVETLAYTWVPVRNSPETRKALAQQVISTSIEADQPVFQQYKSGIFNSTACGKQNPVSQLDLDHAVNLVGYGTEDGQDYFILRNSWGTDWGEDGYMRIADIGSHEGICGVQIEPVWVTPFTY